MSEIRANTISDAAGTGPATLTGQSAAKMWVNFNGTGTVAIKASLNTSSIIDSGVGAYSPNYTNSFASANYSSQQSTGIQPGVTTNVTISYYYKAAGIVTVYTVEAGTPVLFDPEDVDVSGFGDLA